MVQRLECGRRSPMVEELLTEIDEEGEATVEGDESLEE
jgi:hypothetical protein